MLLMFFRKWNNSGWYCFLLIGLLMISMLASASDKKEINREYQLKTAYLQNIFKFVSWPDLDSNHSQVLEFCILGIDPSDGHFQSLNGKVIEKLTLHVSSNIRLDQIGDCNILYDSHLEMKNQINPANLLRKGLLLIGEAEYFSQRGGILNFFIEKNKLRFEINLDAVARVGLTISSKLLRLARITSKE